MTLAPQRRDRSAGEVLPPPGTGGLDTPASLYIHIPFCFHKCHYCDFYSIVDTQDRQEAFTDRLIRELTALAPYSARQPLKTIFAGGGTPSLLRVDLWKRLLTALDRLFDLSEIRSAEARERASSARTATVARAAEFTVECNPETVTPELMETLRAGGVTRVSMGAQSFETRHLKTLERWHDPENVARAIGLARDAGIARQSIDLIFGIPGQTLDDWGRDLERGIGLGTEHVSCYSLTYEPATAMTARLTRGAFEAMDEGVEVDMHRLAWDRLRAAGLDRYEVSNFARPGAECLHNLAYWRQGSWLAAGPSASGHLRIGSVGAEGTVGVGGAVGGGQVGSGGRYIAPGHRWKNTPRLDDYLRKGDATGFSPISDHEGPDAARALRERIMTGLRLCEGLDGGRVLATADGLHPGSGKRLVAAIAAVRDRGQLVVRDGMWILTDEGILFADGIAVELFAALD
ncbi:MAG: radical SAM family heme chaperone HemW [Phycisphaerales bacterium]|nr:radical SAM family heme chaperone HemW [Phycisphaerales bacterium]